MSEWAQEELAAIELGDARLNRRIADVLLRMYNSPQASVKTACGGWAETQAAYRLLDNENVTPEQVLGAHWKCLLERVRAQALVPSIQDTTELDFTRKKALQGRGPLSDSHRQGFFAHTNLVVSGEGLVLGVWRNEITARDPEKVGQSAQRKEIPFEEKESYRWLLGFRDACALSEQAPGSRVVSCADREADIYEVLQEYQTRKAQGLPTAEFSIRSKHNRQTKEVNGAPTTELLREVLEAQAPLATAVETGEVGVAGEVRVPVSAQEQYLKDAKGNRFRRNRTERLATLQVRSCQVTLQPPQRAKEVCPEGLQPVKLQLLLARETRPPAGEEPIEWILLTTPSVATFEEVVELLRLYALRWSIEVFFRVLKTGCKVEELQFKTAERVKLAVTLYLLVAWRVLYTISLGRRCPDLPCGVVFAEDEWRALLGITRPDEKLTAEPRLADMVILVASLGGYLKRKGDGPPGPQALWVGLGRLRDFTLAYQVWVKRQMLE